MGCCCFFVWGGGRLAEVCWTPCSVILVLIKSVSDLMSLSFFLTLRLSIMHKRGKQKRTQRNIGVNTWGNCKFKKRTFMVLLWSCLYKFVASCFDSLRESLCLASNVEHYNNCCNHTKGHLAWCLNSNSLEFKLLTGANLLLEYAI